MTKKDKKIRTIAYIVLCIATVFGIAFAMYVANSEDYPNLQTENARLGLALFTCVALLNLLQGTLRFYDVYNTKIDEDENN